MGTYRLILLAAIVKSCTQIAPGDLLLRVQLDCFLVGFGCVVKPTEAEVRRSQIDVSGIAWSDRYGFLQGIDRLFKLPDFVVDGSDVHLGSVPFGSNLDYLGIHLQGFVVLVAPFVECAEKVIAVATVGMGLDGLLVGLFGFSDLAFVFVGQGQANGSFFVGGFEAKAELEFGGGFRVVSGAIIDKTEADVACGAGVSELYRFIAPSFSRRDPLLL